MLKFLLSVAALAAVTSAQAITWKYGSFDATYKTCKLTGWGGNQPTSGKLTVPSTYTHTDGVTYTVNNIATGALNNLTEVTDITIPGTISHIGDIDMSEENIMARENGTGNFDNCPKLRAFKVSSDNKYFASTSDGLLLNKSFTRLYRVPQAVLISGGKLSLPEQVEVITDDAFSDVTTIWSVTFPGNTFVVSPNAGFHKMPKLSNFKVDALNDYFTVADGALIDTYLNSIVSFPPARTSKIMEITHKAEKVVKNAFANTLYLQKLLLPPTIISIEDEAFAGSSVTTLPLPPGLQSIGRKVFYKSKLTQARIPSRCNIDWTENQHLFASCPQLKQITIEPSEASISEGFARDCPMLESVIFYNVPKEIDKAAFKNCPSLTSFPFSASTNMYGDSIFANTGFERVMFDDGLYCDNTPGNAMFVQCRNLTAIDMSAVTFDTAISSYAFPTNMIASCPKLTEIRLPAVTNFMAWSSEPNIGPNVPLEKLVIGYFEANSGLHDGIVHFYGAKTFTPKTYVKTTDIVSDSWISGMWRLDRLYTAAYGAKVAPVFYCDAVTPSDNYVCKDATYYVPGLCLPYYSAAAEAGCTVSEMFAISIERKPSESTKDALHMYLTSDNTSFKLLSYSILNQDDKTTVITATSNDIVTPISYGDIKQIMLVYTINGEEMKTRYTIAELENSAIGDIADRQASMSLVIDGSTVYISGTTVNVAFSVINVNGAEVLRGTGSAIDLSSLASGTYIIRATDSNSHITDKFHI